MELTHYCLVDPRITKSFSSCQEMSDTCVVIDNTCNQAHARKTKYTQDKDLPGFSQMIVTAERKAGGVRARNHLVFVFEEIKYKYCEKNYSKGLLARIQVHTSSME